MNDFHALGLFALLGAALCVGCKSSDTAGGTASETAARDGAHDPKGLDHADNDAEVVKLAEAALACKWNAGQPAHDCKAHEAWTKRDATAGNSEATLLRMMEDRDAKVRYLAYERLDTTRAKWRADAKQAKRVLAAATKEEEKAGGERVGRLVGMIDADKTGLGDDIKALLKDSKSLAVRKGIVGSVLFNNKKAGGFYDHLQQIAKSDRDVEVRKTAAAAFWTGGSDRPDDTCKLWLELASDKEGAVAGPSAYHCSWWSTGGGCINQWDALLDVIESRGKAGTVPTGFMVSALGWLQKQSKATAAQKKRAIAVAKTIVDNPANKSTRAEAMRVIGEHDPNAKAYAAKYQNDSDGFLKSTAARILDKK
jgi:hypothetical protein